MWRWRTQDSHSECLLSAPVILQSVPNIDANVWQLVTCPLHSRVFLRCSGMCVAQRAIEVELPRFYMAQNFVLVKIPSSFETNSGNQVSLHKVLQVGKKFVVYYVKSHSLSSLGAQSIQLDEPVLEKCCIDRECRSSTI